MYVRSDLEEENNMLLCVGCLEFIIHHFSCLFRTVFNFLSFNALSTIKYKQLMMRN